MSIIATLIISADVPCTGMLMAIRSAASRTSDLQPSIPGGARASAASPP
jgi:hypothetical protein